MTYAELTEKMEKAGNNLAEIAIGRMMDIVEDETGSYPDWNDQAADWVVAQCLGR